MEKANQPAVLAYFAEADPEALITDQALNPLNVLNIRRYTMRNVTALALTCMIAFSFSCGINTAW